jgi:hypothetical protein
MRLAATLFASLAIAACATPLPQIDYYDVDTQALRKIRTMRIIGDASREQGEYQELGTVRGLYCDRSPPYAVTPEDTAIDQVKLRAAISGADHIGTPSCETRTTWDFTNNCFSTVTCSADALVSVR